jgi:hypothetical protein
MICFYGGSQGIAYKETEKLAYAVMRFILFYEGFVGVLYCNLASCKVFIRV